METITLTSFCRLEHKWKFYSFMLFLFWAIIFLFIGSLYYQLAILNIIIMIFGLVFMIGVGIDLLRSMFYMIKYKSFFPIKKYRIYFTRSLNNDEIYLIEKIINDLREEKIVSLFTFEWKKGMKGYCDHFIINDFDKLMLYKLKYC